jgi:hypothetical protein
MRARGLCFSTLLIAACSTDVSTTGSTEQAGPNPNAAVQPGTAVLEEDSPGLLAQATISDAVARAVALKRFPGGQVVDAEIDQDAGRVVYKYELRIVSERRSVDVDIDAKTGAVVAVAEEDVDDEADRQADTRLDTRRAPSVDPRSLRPARQRPRVYIASAQR